MEETQTQTKTPQIFTQLSKVMAEMKEVPKLGQTNFGERYVYRRIDDVYDALHSVMAKHQVFSTSEILDKEISFRKNSKGNSEMHVILHVVYTFYTYDGSCIKTTVYGEGIDSRDKAFNKAIATSHKYALQQLFIIPGNPDTEENNEPVKHIEKKDTASGKGISKNTAKKTPVYSNINEKQKAWLSNVLEKRGVEAIYWDNISNGLNGKTIDTLDKLIKQFCK